MLRRRLSATRSAGVAVVTAVGGGDVRVDEGDNCRELVVGSRPALVIGAGD